MTSSVATDPRLRRTPSIALNPVLAALASFPAVWVAGLWPLYSVILPLVGAKFIASAARTMVGASLISFAFVQIVSVALSVMFSTVDEVRYLAIAHNILVYTLIIVGFGIQVRDPRLIHVLARWSERCIPVFAIAAIVVAGVAWRVGSDLGYTTPFGYVMYSRTDYMLGGAYPRLSLFGDFVNSTAILAFLLFSFAYAVSGEAWSKFYGFLLWCCCSVVVLMSGSRIVLACCLLLLPVLIARGRSSLFTIVLGLTFLVLAELEWNIISLMLDARANSSSMRSYIYSRSVQVWVETNVFTGLGIKPYVHDIPDFPIGSHSSYLGYLVKCGLLAVPFLIAWFVWIVSNACVVTGPAVVSGSRGHHAFSVTVMFLMSCAIWAVEDIDAYEPNALLFGCFLGVSWKLWKCRRGFN